MKTSISIGAYGRRDIKDVMEFVIEAERVGVDHAWSAEAWGTDAVTTLAYLAARTSRIKLGTGIMQISARVPAMTAMTALSMNRLCDGRFILGLGVSGPQVVEGLQGVPYRAPLTRLKENVEIIRMACRGEKVVYDGKYHVLPRPGGEGKAIKVEHAPAEIPIFWQRWAPRLWSILEQRRMAGWVRPFHLTMQRLTFPIYARERCPQEGHWMILSCTLAARLISGKKLMR